MENLLNKLEASKNIRSRRSVSKKISAEMAINPSFKKLFLSLMKMDIASVVSNFLAGTMTEYEVENIAYEDEDGHLKICFFINILQNHESPDNSMESRLMEEISMVVVNKNYDLIINDININGLQMRNSKLNKLEV